MSSKLWFSCSELTNKALRAGTKRAKLDGGDAAEPMSGACTPAHAAFHEWLEAGTIHQPTHPPIIPYEMHTRLMSHAVDDTRLGTSGQGNDQQAAARIAPATAAAAATATCTREQMQQYYSECLQIQILQPRQHEGTWVVKWSVLKQHHIYGLHQRFQWQHVAACNGRGQYRFMAPE